MLDIKAESSTWGSQPPFTLVSLIGKSMRSGVQSRRLAFEAQIHSLRSSDLGPLTLCSSASVSSYENEDVTNTNRPQLLKMKIKCACSVKECIHALITNSTNVAGFSDDE